MKEEIELTPLTLAIPENSGLEIESQQSLIALFQPLFDKANEWREKALACRVTDINDKHGMKFARESRLGLREIRLEVEKRRKAAKEDSLRKGRAIDGMANVFKAAVEPIEEFLLEQEQFAERHEAARIATLQGERLSLMMPYGCLDSMNTASLGTLTQEGFEALLADAKALHEMRRERERKAEQERLEREIAEAKERERIKQELEQLRRESHEREAAAKIEHERVEAEAKAAAEAARKEREALESAAAAERQAAAAKQAKERKAREKAEAEARELREAEKRRQAEEAARLEIERAAKEEAERKAANAPEKDKLLAFAATVRSLTVPEVSTAEARGIAAEIAAKVEGFAKWIEKQTVNL